MGKKQIKDKGVNNKIDRKKLALLGVNNISAQFIITAIGIAIEGHKFLLDWRTVKLFATIVIPHFLASL